MLLVLGLAFGLCACQKTPEQIKQNMAEYGENKQVGQSEITYCTVEELRNAKMPDVDMGAVALPETVDFSDVYGVSVLHLLAEKDFFGEDRVEEGETDAWEETVRYVDSKDPLMDMSKSGGLAQKYRCGEAPAGLKVENVYHMDEENWKGDAAGVDIRLGEDAERWLEEEKPVGGGICYKVSDVYVSKKIVGNKRFSVLSLCAEYDYKGIRLNNHTIPLREEGGAWNADPITAQMFTVMDYEKKGKPCFFSRNVRFYLKSSEPVENIVDLPSALQIVKEKLSGSSGSFHITKVTPLYVPYFGKKGEDQKMRIEVRPVYAFLMEEQEPGLKDGFQSKCCQNFLYVDMLTGELTAGTGN